MFEFTVGSQFFFWAGGGGGGSLFSYHIIYIT